MDHTLSREESIKLMQLLNLPLEQYGNFPLMRKAFLKRCKVMHPDKGGEPEAAKELISLYKRLEECLPPLHVEEGFSTSQVCATDNFKIFNDWVRCKEQKISCTCIFCLLRMHHKDKSSRRPKCWGTCLCFHCYITWFGLEDTEFIFESWMNLIGNVPFRALRV
nr:small T antigen [Rhinolophus affinis polyomavirus 3]BBG62053.1 small T antigen [Rhinolophus affinis polyomavirus 3]BBG62059.1 small T antigen [Rhinolophus affinis polyomavirus 3]